jgi:hypothetical protein
MKELPGISDEHFLGARLKTLRAPHELQASL